jgi:hypothetical protein
MIIDYLCGLKKASTCNLLEDINIFLFNYLHSQIMIPFIKRKNSENGNKTDRPGKNNKVCIMLVFLGTILFLLKVLQR